MDFITSILSPTINGIGFGLIVLSVILVIREMRK